MTDEEISQVKRGVYEIQQEQIDKQVGPIEALAKRINAPIPTKHGQGNQEFVNETVRHIHTVLQTETMINTCRIANKSCRWAAVAATLSFFGILGAWLAIVVMILIAVFVK